MTTPTEEAVPPPPPDAPQPDEAEAEATSTPSVGASEAASSETWEDVCGDGTLLKQVVKAASGGALSSSRGVSPQKGDKCKVHYVGRVTETQAQFDSSRDRGQPFSFTIGHGVIEGWSEAVPTMQVGEIALFRIASGKAYGADGSPPSIPGDAALDFEIELLSFTDREDITGDGTVLKKVLTEGSGWQRPNKMADVELDVSTPWTETSRTIAWPASKSREDLVLDDGLTFPRALRTGVETMKKGEKALVEVRDAKDSSKAPVDYDVRLKSWVDNEDCVPDVPGAVVKRTTGKPHDEANNWKTPNETDTVRVLGSVYRADDPSRAPLADLGTIIDMAEEDDDAKEEGNNTDAGASWMLDEVPAGETISVVVKKEDGEESTRKQVRLCEGLEAGLKRMKVGEEATLHISAAYGFAEGEAARVPLEARVKLCAIESEKDSWDMSPDEKVASVGKKRALGNAHFARKDFARAIRRYDAAVQLGASEYDVDEPADKAALKAACAAARLNRAAAYLKTGDFAKAKADATDVLADDPENAKALFRRAKANTALDEWHLARADLKKLLAADDKNLDARRALADVTKREKAHKEKQKKLYAGRKLFAANDPRSAGSSSSSKAKPRAEERADDDESAPPSPDAPPEAPAPPEPYPNDDEPVAVDDASAKEMTMPPEPPTAVEEAESAAAAEEVPADAAAAE